MQRPAVLFREWVRIDTDEQSGKISEHEARRRKRDVFALMQRLGLTPDDVLPPDALLRWPFPQ